MKKILIALCGITMSHGICTMQNNQNSPPIDLKITLTSNDIRSYAQWISKTGCQDTRAQTVFSNKSTQLLHGIRCDMRRGEQPRHMRKYCYQPILRHVGITPESANIDNEKYTQADCKDITSPTVSAVIDRMITITTQTLKDIDKQQQRVTDVIDNNIKNLEQLQDDPLQLSSFPSSILCALGGTIFYYLGLNQQKAATLKDMFFSCSLIAMATHVLRTTFAHINAPTKTRQQYENEKNNTHYALLQEQENIKENILRLLNYRKQEIDWAKKQLENSAQPQ